MSVNDDDPVETIVTLITMGIMFAIPWVLAVGFFFVILKIMDEMNVF